MGGRTSDGVNIEYSGCFDVPMTWLYNLLSNHEPLREYVNDVTPRIGRNFNYFKSCYSADTKKDWMQYYLGNKFLLGTEEISFSDLQDTDVLLKSLPHEFQCEKSISNCQNTNCISQSTIQKHQMTTPSLNDINTDVVCPKCAEPIEVNINLEVYTPFLIIRIQDNVFLNRFPHEISIPTSSGKLSYTMSYVGMKVELENNRAHYSSLFYDNENYLHYFQPLNVDSPLRKMVTTPNLESFITCIVYVYLAAIHSPVDKKTKKRGPKTKRKRKLV